MCVSSSRSIRKGSPSIEQQFARSINGWALASLLANGIIRRCDIHPGGCLEPHSIRQSRATGKVPLFLGTR